MARRTVAALVLAGAVVAGLGAGGTGRTGEAQERFPSRPIDFIVTWGTGGGADAMARQLAALAQPLLGVPLPVSNVPGASGNTGLAQVLAGRADGYTIATYIQDTLMTIPMGLARHTVGDLAWIVRTQVADSFLFVRADGPFQSVQDLFRQAQAQPGKLRVATTGFGTVDDVSVRFLEKKGYPMTVVPYPKPAERYAAVLGGHAEVLYEQAGDVLQYLRAGQLRPLLIFAGKRHPAFPEVPTSRELGIEITLPQFRGVVARGGTPPDRVRVLADAFRKAMETPQWQKFAQEWYMAPDSYQGPEEFTRWVAAEVETLERLVRELGLRK